MGPEFATISGAAGMFAGFEKLTVVASFHAAARTFELEAAAQFGPIATFAQFRAGTAMSISSNGSLMCSGYVDRYQPSISEHTEAKIWISGRSRAQDFIDSSAKHDSGQFDNKTPAEIGQALDLFGVGITTDEQLDKVPIYRITPGETAFRCVEKLCREQGVFVVGQADGSIKLTKGGKQTHAGGIFEGRNMKSGEADHNFSGRHSDIIVRGQRPIGHGDDALQIEQKATDSSIRYRPVIIIHDGDTDNKRAKKRAKTRRDREAGNSLKARVVVQGFRDDGGTLWEPGNLVFLQSPFLGIAQNMAIETATFVQDRKQGSLTTLALVDPKALGGDGAKGGSITDAWGSSAGSD